MRMKRKTISACVVVSGLGIVAACAMVTKFAAYRIQSIEAEYHGGIESYCDPDAVRYSQTIGDEVIAALEAYRESSGVYPATLAQLVPLHLPDLRKPTAGAGEWSYCCYAEGQQMRLAFGVGKYVYPCYYWDSADGRWREDS